MLCGGYAYGMAGECVCDLTTVLVTRRTERDKARTRAVAQELGKNTTMRLESRSGRSGSMATPTCARRGASGISIAHVMNDPASNNNTCGGYAAYRCNRNVNNVEIVQHPCHRDRVLRPSANQEDTCCCRGRERGTGSLDLKTTRMGNIMCKGHTWTMSLCKGHTTTTSPTINAVRKPRELIQGNIFYNICSKTAL